MRATYDSEADALSIDLINADRWDGADPPVHDDYCHVALAGGKPANIELLFPRELPENLDFLDEAAERYGLDPEALRVAAIAAMSAPDRPVELTLGDKLTTADS